MTTSWRPGRATVLRARVTVEGRAARFAHVSAVHAAGDRLDVRADGHGRVSLPGLPAGTWNLTARDARGLRCSTVATVTVDAAASSDVDLELTTPTSRLLVRLTGPDRRPVRASEVSLVDVTGRRVTAVVREGLADLRGLLPGAHTLVVPPSLGHLGSREDVGPLAPGVLAACESRVALGAIVSGRVVQGRLQYAAVVSLLDADGVEVERCRTDGNGRFELGTGLRTTAGLTVVATTGPETLHVTRAACADVDVVTGVRHDLGDIVLPVVGARAVWTARTPPGAGMRLPSTRV